jgi:RNA polymerase sigma-70 factor (ECF subfamily)
MKPHKKVLEGMRIKCFLFGGRKWMDSCSEAYSRFLSGDKDAMTEIIIGYRDGLLLFLKGIVGDIYIAEDIMEQTFMLLAIKKPRDKGGSSFKTWLYTIARNLAIDYLRKKRRSNEVDIEAIGEIWNDENLLEEKYIKKEEQILIRRAMNNLRNEYRQVLWLSYFEEMSNKEISKVMKKSIRSVEAMLYRAKKALREELEKEGINGVND